MGQTSVTPSRDIRTNPSGDKCVDWPVAAHHDRKNQPGHVDLAGVRGHRRDRRCTLDGIITALRAAGYEFVIPKS
jgi:hypothetical protein